LTATPISTQAGSNLDSKAFDDPNPLSTPIADLREVRECVEQLAAGYGLPSRSRGGSGGKSRSFPDSYGSYKGSSFSSTITSKATNSTASTGRRQREQYFKSFGVGHVCMVCSSPGKESGYHSPRYSINTEEPSGHSSDYSFGISRLSIQQSSTCTTSSENHQGSPVFAC